MTGIDITLFITLFVTLFITLFARQRSSPFGPAAMTQTLDRAGLPAVPKYATDHVAADAGTGSFQIGESELSRKGRVARK
jgi:hypothetical protein